MRPVTAERYSQEYPSTRAQRAGQFICIVCVLLGYVLASSAVWTLQKLVFSDIRYGNWLNDFVLKCALVMVSMFYLSLWKLKPSQAGISMGNHKPPSRVAIFSVITVPVFGTMFLLVLRAISLGPHAPFSIGQVLCTCLLAPVAEEIYIRGWFQTVFAQNVLNQRIVVWTSAGMFALLHLFRYFKGQPLGETLLLALGALLLGLVVSKARQNSGSIFQSALLHMIYNTTGIFLTFAFWLIGKDVLKVF